MTALLLAALAVGIDNFAVAISLGLGVVDARSRLLITTVFGLFEAGMPLLGLLLGNRVAHGLGGTAADVGGALLIAMGAWTALQNHRGNHAGHEPVSVGSARQGALLVTAFALSIDNLIVGFGMGVTRTSLLAALGTFAAVSVALTLLGLQFGAGLGKRTGDSSESLSAGLLVLIGALILPGVF